MALLGQRAVRAGLPPVVAVSPQGIGQRCPACGVLRRLPAGVGGLFLCVSCGHVQPKQQLGAANLARALERYGRTQLRVRESHGQEKSALIALPWPCIWRRKKGPKPASGSYSR